MIERLRRVKFAHFRGLPDTEIKFDGKSLVLLGSNGKGKSAVVDGIEFLFSGKVGRFVGTGTGTINHDDALQHVQKRGIATVSVTLSPYNATVSRGLGAASLEFKDATTVAEYLGAHSEVDAFVLRRAKILDFVSDQDANRYQKFVKLLGISRVDGMQKSFSDAERTAQEASQRAESTLRTKLAVFIDPTVGFEPRSASDVLSRLSTSAVKQGVEAVGQWADIESRLTSLKALRPAANSEQLDAVTRALVSLETALPDDISVDIVAVNQLRVRLKDLGDSLTDAPRSLVIAAATKYLAAHAEDTVCPVCERDFDRPLADVVERLRSRADALRELQECTDRRKEALRRVKRYCEDLAAQASKDLAHENFLDAPTIAAIKDARASALEVVKLLPSLGQSLASDDLALPNQLITFGALRLACVPKLNVTRESLIAPDTSELEAAIALLERGRASLAELHSSEDAVRTAILLSTRSKVARDAFSKARESAIQTVFNAIADTVLNFYNRLHDADDIVEKSECTGLELKSTSRAAAGGLRLAVQFLSVPELKDPRGFLSEGHLDSLGLCIFLATVKIFNRPGTLLVLDDVMTSIDKDHRRRVGELLFQEFSEYQIIITTHDEHWRDLLRSSAEAWGIQRKWSFKNVEAWTLDSGPQVSEVTGSWEFIDAHMNESDYRQLGGPFRIVFESFLKRCAEKLEVKVRFKMDPRYTAGDFVHVGIHNTIRDKLIELSPADDVAIRTSVGRVFGQGDFVNFLSHDNSGRLELSFDQASDFVSGLRDLTKRCEDHKLIKGLSA